MNDYDYVGIAGVAVSVIGCLVVIAGLIVSFVARGPNRFDTQWRAITGCLVGLIVVFSGVALVLIAGAMQMSA